MVTQQENIVVFDIGGTWFRSGVYVGTKQLQSLTKGEAYNFKNTPHKHPRELQIKLVDYLTQQVQYFRRQNITIDAAAISMGAALNGHTGEILNSGPLWGPNCEKFDLLKNLTSKMPDVEWVVVNDVSAALLRHVVLPQNRNLKRVSLMTVSSGIACRTYESAGSYVPLNKMGIQGEIGHIPIQFSILGRTLREVCDCGGINHLNAFSSGRGIENVLREVAKFNLTDKSSFGAFLSQSSSPKEFVGRFFEAVRVEDELASSILDAVTYPIAQTIVNMLTIDAEIEKIIMTGGVVHSIEQQYMQSLLKNLEQVGLYQISDPPAFFRKIIETGVNDDKSGLLGVAIAYENRTSKTL